MLMQSRVCRWIVALGLAAGLSGFACASSTVASDEVWIGAGLNREDAYAGAAHGANSLVPLVDADFGRWFVRSSRGYGEAGWRYPVGNGWGLGAQLGFERGRASADLSEYAKHRGYSAISPGAGIGLHAQWKGKLGGKAPVTTVLRYRHRLGEQGGVARGALLDWRYEMGVYEYGQFGLGVFYQGIWGNAQAMQSDVGLSAAQAQAGHLANSPSAGWREHGYGLSSKWDWSDRTMLVASIKRKRYGRAVVDSPLAESTGHTGFTLGVVWRYR